MIRFAEWYADARERKSFVPVGLVIAILLLWFGHYLAIVRPQQLVASNQSEANKSINAARELCKTVDDKLGQMTWFAPAYSAQAGQDVVTSRALLDEGPKCATMLFSQGGKGSWRQRLKYYKAALKTARDAVTTAQRGVDSLTAAFAKRDDAISKTSRVGAELQAASEAMRLLHNRIESESRQYPSRYGKELRQTYAAIDDNCATTSKLLASSRPFLPEMAEASGKGDPDGALRFLDKALSTLERIRGDNTTLVARLDGLKAANAQADFKVTSARAMVSEARETLQRTQRETGFWLKDAASLLAEADQQSDESRRLLVSIEQGETAPDRVAAFEMAKKAAKTRDAVLASVNAEVALAARARTEVRALAGEVDDFARVAQACDQRSALARYHAASAWPAGHPAQGTVDRYRLSQRQAAYLCSLDTQRFAESERTASHARSQLANERREAEAFIRAVDALERDRMAYEGEYRRASDVIEAESGNIRAYGSYDSGAKSDYENAEEQLRQAANLAANRQYSPAVARARTAYTQAEGTGERARAAHQRHEEEEEAARRAAEEAARSAMDDDDSSSSSGGFGGGGSDSGFGGGGGGSDSDIGGGGSDSDIGGGGSDSDY